MARPTPGRKQFHYLESWLLPSLGLRANIFHFNDGFHFTGGYERPQDFYLDVGEFTAGTDCWHAVDYYLDLVVYTGDRTDLVDVDELFEAHRHGLVTAATAERAIRCASAAIAGLARRGNDLNAWLASIGIDLSWRNGVDSLP
jgi:predicted RNA-binding protein associated with RNAse of E/G family